MKLFVPVTAFVVAANTAYACFVLDMMLMGMAMNAGVGLLNMAGQLVKGMTKPQPPVNAAPLPPAPVALTQIPKTQWNQYIPQPMITHICSQTGIQPDQATQIIVEVGDVTVPTTGDVTSQVQSIARQCGVPVTTVQQVSGIVWNMMPAQTYTGNSFQACAGSYSKNPYAVSHTGLSNKSSFPAGSIASQSLKMGQYQPGFLMPAGYMAPPPLPNASPVAPITVQSTPTALVAAQQGSTAPVQDVPVDVVQVAPQQAPYQPTAPGQVAPATPAQVAPVDTVQVAPQQESNLSGASSEGVPAPTAQVAPQEVSYQPVAPISASYPAVARR
ncbi:hypothetical protein BC830DRAFT_831956 [Chytriomyces sp. MP71]|nr:hypothetical protein BC830DRAFT_831956 [Chytriomyces sp. MP71]